MTNQLQHQQRRPDYRIPAIEKYAYCLCLHVKPTTIFIAVFKLIRALLFASILLNTEFTVSDQAPELGLAVDDRHKSTAIAVHIFTRIVTASVSAIGIYAVISGRAALLMPLYAMLLVDFFFALPAFYNRDLDPTLADSMSDFRGYPTNNNQYTRYSAMLFSTITMIVKIYFLCVIWKCYRYLRLIELVSPIRLSEIYPHIHQNGPQYPIVRVLSNGDSTDLSNGTNMAPPPYESIASNMKPPNYEEAMKSSSMNFATNSAINPQQTVVFTNLAAEPHQNHISTQVLPVNIEGNVEVATAGIMSENINQSLTSRTSTVPSHAAISPTNQGLNTSDQTSVVENSTPNVLVENSPNSREIGLSIPRAKSGEIQRDIH